MEKIASDHSDITYMNLALEQAQKAAALGEVPVGAIAVYKGKIIAENHNRIEIDKNASAHAEMLVLRQACNHLDRWRLDDVTIYVTVEPCPMCAMAMVLHRIRRVVFATSEPRTGAGGSFINLLQNPALNHTMEMTAGICREQASQLMKHFFQTRRKQIPLDS